MPAVTYPQATSQMKNRHAIIAIQMLTLCLLFTGCSTLMKDRYDVHQLRVSNFSLIPKDQNRIQKGKIYSLPLHAEHTWQYHCLSGGCVISWDIFPQKHMPLTPIEPGNILDVLKIDCENWKCGSQKVNGWPDNSSLLGVFILQGEKVPIFEWTTKEGDKTNFDYVSALPVLGTSMRATLIISSVSTGLHQVEASVVLDEICELVNSADWKKLYRKNH